MARGRKPKAERIDKSHPNYRPYRHDPEHMYPTNFGGLPLETSHLDGKEEARWMWDLVHNSIPHSVLSTADTAVLITACEWWQIYCDLIKRYMADLSDGRIGDQACRAFTNFNKSAAQFGLSPAARQTLKIEPAKEVGDDKMAELIKGVVG